ncbi:MAG: isochorismatase family protein [Rhodospirillaceae bacterium]|nr:isochorismatase family protein [Rhodospirillaceae bacterium]MBT7265827.1 isochorismatase family protein [Rhodospirillaceae bacterium]
MAERIWDKYISERDQGVFDAAGFGQNAGFGERPVLMIVDVSYAFCGDKREPIHESIKTWKLSCGEAAWDAMPVLIKLIEAARAKGIPVIYTTGYGRDDKWDRGSWAWKNPRGENLENSEPAPVTNRDGNDIVDEIAPAAQDIVVLKQKPSAFHEAPMMSYLNLLKADSVIVTGTTTSGCVRATAVDAFSHNFHVSVVEDACFDRSDVSHAVSLLDLHAKYADVHTSDAIIDYINGLPDDLFDLPSGKSV